MMLWLFDGDGGKHIGRAIDRPTRCVRLEWLSGATLLLPDYVD